MKKSIKQMLLLCLSACLVITALVGISYSKYADKIELGSFSLSVVVADEDPSASLVGIVLSRMPDTTVYAVGDNFDTTGMIITGEYADGSETDITDYTLSNHKNIQLNQTSVGVSYGKYDLSVPIDVGYRIRYNGNGGLFGESSTNDVIVVSGNTVVTRISKSDNVSDDGSTYVGGYGDDQERNDVITIPGATSLEVTISYATESVDYDWVAVYDGSVEPAFYNSHLSVSGPLGDDELTTETFVIQGDTVQIFLCSDGSVSDYYGYYAVITATVAGSEVIGGEYAIPERGGYAFDGWYTNSNCSVGSEFNEDAVVEKNMTVYASWFEIYPIEITIATPPDLVTYNPGDEFDPTGMVVEVTYSDGSVKYISDYDILDGDMLSDDQSTVTISYTDVYSDITLEVEQPVSVVFPQAIYIESTGELIFDVTTKLEAGDEYNGNIVTATYTGFIDDIYTVTDNAPWYEYRESITSVRFESTITPVSTAYWFADMTNCKSIEFDNLDMSCVESAECMFAGCSSLTVIDLRSHDLSNLENTDEMFLDCTAVTRAFAANEEDMIMLNMSLNRPLNWEFYILPGVYDTDEEYDRLVAEYALKYINEYRVSEGAPELEMLPGMLLVAEYRADQLITNYTHSQDDMKEAHNYYKYGTYVDLSSIGGDSYYASGSPEGICAFGIGAIGTIDENADAAGQRIADLFYNSKSHWSYIGSADNLYVGIGVEYLVEDNVMYGKACVMVNGVNYG